MSDVRTFSVKRVTPGTAERVVDRVAVEEPFAITIKYWQKDAELTQNLAVTMRTPGHDAELAAGLLLAEGVINTKNDIADIRALGGDSSNELLIELAKGVDFNSWHLTRNGIVSSSCGVCGKRSQEAVILDLPSIAAHGFTLTSSVIQQLPAKLAQQQSGFQETGGFHAAALVTPAGDIESLFEDIGRHNALDKLIGSSLLRGQTPLHQRAIFLSSRGSFELVQKAAMAGAPFLATVGGPSSLAIETARAVGLTLLGFVRDGRFNIYSGDWRVN